MSKQVVRTERGWAGHFCSSDRCLFRRNTLLELDQIRVVVSTVGLLRWFSEEIFEHISPNRYFETMCFIAKWDGRYWDVDVTKEVAFSSPWSIDHLDADDEANLMHERVVEEIGKKMLSGEIEVKK